MLLRVNRILGLLAVLSMLVALLPAAALANPPAPEQQVAPSVAPTADSKLPMAARAAGVKPIDQPNIKDYLRNRQRQALNEAGLTAQASALALTGTDRVLVVLVEFAGTDVITWNAGSSQWDPLGMADPNEAVYDGDGNVVVGDCSNIITQTTVFTYTGPLHNELPRPLSATDRSGDSIWTEDFSPQWFTDFMFGNGVTFNYTRTDESLVYEDFTGKSVAKYYQEFSNNTYNVTGDVVGWLQLPHSTQWYGADQCPGARSGGGSNAGAIPAAGNSRSLVRDALDAVNAANPDFDWSLYDQDLDGVIDRLWIVHSGYGEEDSTTLLNRTAYGESALWSHSSAVTPAYAVGDGVSAGPYIMMPENGGIGVFAHEYGHNLGADDLYAYGNGETSAGFWTVMADDWTGYPIGFQPPSPDPWHLDNWGWLDPAIISDPNQVYTVTLGQASSFPGGAGVSRAAKIPLAAGAAPLAVPVWQGSYYWWGGKADLANARMTTVDSVPAYADSTLSFDLVYDIEDQWDYLWVQVSTDGGATWPVANTLTNTNTTCDHVVDWVGGLYGFPDDMCAAGIGGFTNYNANWPNPQVQTFDLSRFAGQNIKVRLWYMTDWGTSYTGAFVDNVTITGNSATQLSDNAESGDAKWTYAAPWVRSNGSQSFTHNFYLQWRNVSSTGGYDSALGDPRWRYGPANTGLVLWYNNNNYTDNEIFNYLTDYPGWGPKGRMLVVDANYDPYREPAMVAAGYNNEGGNLVDRSLMRDAPFSKNPSVPFTMTNYYAYGNATYTTGFAGRPAVNSFHDAFGYFPGAEYVSRGPYYPLATAMRWVTKQWDASTVIPAKSFYGIKAPGYIGTGGTTKQEFRWMCSSHPLGALSCYWYGGGVGLGYNGGSGNPGDQNAQFGWHFQILEQTASTATVKIWNAQKEAAQSLTPNKLTTFRYDTVTYTYNMTQNQGTALNIFACAPLDAAKVEFVSATNGGMPLNISCPAAAAAATAGQPLAGMAAAPEAAVAVGWTGPVATAASATFDFTVKVKAASGVLNQSVTIYDNWVPWRTVWSVPVTILPIRQYLPSVVRQ